MMKEKTNKRKADDADIANKKPRLEIDDKKDGQESKRETKDDDEDEAEEQVAMDNDFFAEKEFRKKDDDVSGGRSVFGGIISSLLPDWF